MAMGRHKEKLLWNVLLGSSVYLLDSLRERLSGNLDDVKERARDTYDTATDRVSRATDVIRGRSSRTGDSGGHSDWSGNRRGRGNVAGTCQRRRNAQQPGGEGAGFWKQDPQPGFV